MIEDSMKEINVVSPIPLSYGWLGDTYGWLGDTYGLFNLEVTLSYLYSD